MVTFSYYCPKTSVRLMFWHMREAPLWEDTPCLTHVRTFSLNQVQRYLIKPWFWPLCFNMEVQWLLKFPSFGKGRSPPALSSLLLPVVFWQHGSARSTAVFMKSADPPNQTFLSPETAHLGNLLGLMKPGSRSYEAWFWVLWSLVLGLMKPGSRSYEAWF